MVKISGERLREVSIPIPWIPMQEEIVMRLDAARKIIKRLALESNKSEIGALRTAIIRKAFAGELLAL